MLNHDYKNNNSRNFRFTKISFIDSVLTDRRSLSSKRPKPARGKSSSCRFSFSAERNANAKATEYVTFDFSSPFRKVWTSLSISDTDFFLCLAVRIRDSFDKQLVLRIVKALLFIHQLDRAAPKASDVAAADWLYQDTWKNTMFFSRVLVRLFSGPDILLVRCAHSWAIELNTRREIHFYARPSIILCLIKTCLTDRLHALRFSFHFAFFRLMKNYQKHTKKAVGQ